MTAKTIVAISAGLGEPSSTRMLADRLTESTVAELSSRGIDATASTIELREFGHDIVNAMLTGFSAAPLAAAVEKATRADGLVLATPLFTTTYSGLFKSFIDVLDKDSLTGMPVLLAATGGTARHSLALEYSMRPLLTYLRAEVVPTSVFAATDDWAGEQANPLSARIARAGRELAEAVTRTNGARPLDIYRDAPSFDQMIDSLQN